MAVSAFSKGDKPLPLTHRRGGAASQWIPAQRSIGRFKFNPIGPVQHEQHIGMLFIRTQQVQPAFIMAVMHAQQA